MTSNVQAESGCFLLSFVNIAIPDFTIWDGRTESQFLSSGRTTANRVLQIPYMYFGSDSQDDHSISGMKGTERV